MVFPKKSALSLPSVRFSRSSGGVTKIKRDSYGEDWRTMTAAVRRRDQFKCVFCQKPEDMKSDPKVYHDVHHLIELSGGGRTVMSNLVTICKTCHARRHPHLRKAGYGKTKRPFK